MTKYQKGNIIKRKYSTSSGLYHYLVTPVNSNRVKILHTFKDHSIDLVEEGDKITIFEFQGENKKVNLNDLNKEIRKKVLNEFL